MAPSPLVRGHSSSLTIQLLGCSRPKPKEKPCRKQGTCLGSCLVPLLAGTCSTQQQLRELRLCLMAPRGDFLAFLVSRHEKEVSCSVRWGRLGAPYSCVSLSAGGRGHFGFGLYFERVKVCVSLLSSTAHSVPCAVVLSQGCCTSGFLLEQQVRAYTGHSQGLRGKGGGK